MPAAIIVRMFAEIIVVFLPNLSKRIPVRIRPMPLKTESTPTSVVAREGAASTDSIRSLAKLITQLPTAVINAIQMKALIKVKLLII